MVHGVGFFIFLLPMVAGECSEIGVCLVNNLNLVRLLLLSNDKCRSVFFGIYIQPRIQETYKKVYEVQLEKLIRSSLLPRFH